MLANRPATIELSYTGRYSALLSTPSLSKGPLAQSAILMDIVSMEQVVMFLDAAAPRPDVWHYIANYDALQNATGQF